MEYADLDALVDRCVSDAVPDPLSQSRLKSGRLALRHPLERLEGLERAQQLQEHV